MFSKQPSMFTKAAISDKVVARRYFCYNGDYGDPSVSEYHGFTVFEVNAASWTLNEYRIGELDLFRKFPLMTHELIQEAISRKGFWPNQVLIPE